MLEPLLGAYVPDSGGALWLGLLVALALFGDFRRLAGPRNLALLGLLASAPLLAGISYLARNHPRARAWAWTAIFVITAGHTLWALALTRRARPAWVPNVARRGLVIVALLLVGMNVLTAVAKKPDDAGRYVNLGTQRWLETGMLPYADPQLRGPEAPGFGAATTYGPLLYVAHLPALLMIARPRNASDAVVKPGVYTPPPDLATQLVAIAFHLAGLAALFVIVRRLASTEAALGAVALYASMPYLAGLGGVTGLRFVSHVAPTGLLLMALATTSRAFLSGALFAASAGTLFFPVFLFPAWLLWRVWRRDHPLRFVAGVATAGLGILALVVLFTPAPTTLDSLSLFVRSVVEHQEGSGFRQYGASRFGFWGTHPSLAAFWHEPLLGTSPFADPAFLLFLVGCVVVAWRMRGGSLSALAGGTAAVGAGVQLWKTHGGGTYIEWYLAFLILALVVGRDEDTGAARGVLDHSGGDRRDQRTTPA